MWRWTHTSSILTLCLAGALLSSDLCGRPLAAFDTSTAIACGGERPEPTAPAGSTSGAIGPTKAGAYWGAMVALFGIAAIHPGCESCPPETPNGCAQMGFCTGFLSNVVENPDGSFTVTVEVGPAGGTRKNSCTSCFGEGAH